MALFTILKALVDDDINTNGIQAITGAVHNDVLNELIDAVGAAQVYVNPSVTDNPGTPQNNRAYIALPGLYTNFGALEITAPLGVLAWNGTSWSVTQLGVPSAYEYRKCRTTSALTTGTPYTSVNVGMLAGGWIAKAGQWVQLINRKTGVYDHVQLAADISLASTAITFPSYTIQKDFPIHSIVEVDPAVNMKWHGIELFGDGVNNYVTVPSDWRLPPLAATDPTVWVDLMGVSINAMSARWEPTPVGPFDYNVVNDATRLKVYFADVLDTNTSVVVRVYQPRVLTLTA